MKKILIIIQREFMTRVSKKSFILLTIFMPFIFATLIFLPLWLAGIESDEQRTVMVADKTGSYVHLFEDSKNYRFVPTAETDNAAFYSDSSDIEAVIAIYEDLAVNPKAVTIYSRKEVTADLLSYTKDVLNEQVRKDKLASYKVEGLEHIIKEVETDFDIATVKRNEAGDETISSTDMAIAAGFIFTFLIYLFVMTYGGMVMQSVIEEKSNRIVELMVSSVKPFQLMMGKIIGVALVGFVQLFIWGVMLTIILLVCSAIFGFSPDPNTTQAMLEGAQGMPAMNIPTESNETLAALMNLPFTELIIMFILYFVGGYLLYASFFAAVGASINTQEDSSQFITPVILIMVFGLYAAMYSAENTDGPLAFWASMIPLTSPIVMMVRIPFSVPLWQELLSLGILYGTAIFFVWAGGKIYQVGILMYGKKPNIKEMIKWMRYK